jgi:hypothetical protein
MKARRTPFFLTDSFTFSMTNPTCYYDGDSMDTGSSLFSYTSATGIPTSDDFSATVTMDSATNLVNGDHEYSITVTAEGGASATAYGSMLIATPTGSTLEDLTGYPDCEGPSCTFYSDYNDFLGDAEYISTVSSISEYKEEPSGYGYCQNTMGFGELSPKTLRLYSCTDQFIESADSSLCTKDTEVSTSTWSVIAAAEIDTTDDHDFLYKA